MSSPPTTPNHPDESAADSSTYPSTPENRDDSPPIRVPSELIPPEEPVAPTYGLSIPAIEQLQTSQRSQLDVPPDFRVPWRWTDVILFAIFYFGSAIVVGVVLLGLSAATMHRSVQALANDKPFTAVMSIMAQAIASGLSLLYLWVLVRVRQGGAFWQTIGWRPLPRDPSGRVHPLPLIFGGIGLAAIAGIADQFFPSKQNLPMEQMFQTREALILLSLFGVLIAPFIEETIFRGFLYPVVGRSFGAGAAILLTGTIFGAYHAPQLWGGWAQIGLIMIVGVILTWARSRQKTVLAGFLIHISYNSTIFLVLLISTGGFRHIQP